MQASIKTETDGMVNWRLDPEAAQAVFASVVFASRSTKASRLLL
jgi:hypothetical protein